MSCNQCSTGASFAMPSSFKPITCIEHMSPGMINLRARKCIVCNEKSGTANLTCPNHRGQEPDRQQSTDVCGHPFCQNKKARYGSAVGIRCKNHRLHGMHRIKREPPAAPLMSKTTINPILQDLLNRVTALEGRTTARAQTVKTARRCRYDTCMVTASYNYPESSGAVFCTRHKKSGMVGHIERAEYRRLEGSSRPIKL